MIKSRWRRWEGHTARMRAKRNAYRVLVETPKGRRPAGSHGRKWVDNIKMDIRETRWGDMDWIDLAQDSDRWWALVNTAMNLWVALNILNSLSS
jgi:hypothetical protein